MVRVVGSQAEASNLVQSQSAKIKSLAIRIKLSGDNMSFLQKIQAKYEINAIRGLKNNQDVMVWKNEDDLFHFVVPRPTTTTPPYSYSGWELFTYDEKSRLPQPQFKNNLNAFNPDKSWGERLPLNKVPQKVKDFILGQQKLPPVLWLGA